MFASPVAYSARCSPRDLAGPVWFEPHGRMIQGFRWSLLGALRRVQRLGCRYGYVDPLVSGMFYFKRMSELCRHYLRGFPQDLVDEMSDVASVRELGKLYHLTGLHHATVPCGIPSPCLPEAFLEKKARRALREKQALWALRGVTFDVPMDRSWE